MSSQRAGWPNDQWIVLKTRKGMTETYGRCLWQLAQHFNLCCQVQVSLGWLKLILAITIFSAEVTLLALHLVSLPHGYTADLTITQNSSAIFNPAPQPVTAVSHPFTDLVSLLHELPEVTGIHQVIKSLIVSHTRSLPSIAHCSVRLDSLKLRGILCIFCNNLKFVKPSSSMILKTKKKTRI